MNNQKWVDSVLGRKTKEVLPKNQIIDNAWDDLRAGKITAFEYNRTVERVKKYQSVNFI